MWQTYMLQCMCTNHLAHLHDHMECCDRTVICHIPPPFFTSVSSFPAQAAILEEPIDPPLVLHGPCQQRQNVKRCRERPSKPQTP